MCPSVKRFRTSSLIAEIKVRHRRPAKMNCVTTEIKCMASDYWTLGHGGPTPHKYILQCTSHVRFGSKADIRTAKSHVRFTPKADMCSAQRDVRYGPIADHNAYETFPPLEPLGASLTLRIGKIAIERKADILHQGVDAKMIALGRLAALIPCAA